MLDITEQSKTNCGMGNETAKKNKAAPRNLGAELVPTRPINAEADLFQATTQQTQPLYYTK